MATSTHRKQLLALAQLLNLDRRSTRRRGESRPQSATVPVAAYHSIHPRPALAPVRRACRSGRRPPAFRRAAAPGRSEARSRRRARRARRPHRFPGQLDAPAPGSPRCGSRSPLRRAARPPRGRELSTCRTGEARPAAPSSRIAVPTLPAAPCTSTVSPLFAMRHAVKHLVGGHVGEDEAQDLRRVEVVGHLDRVRLRHADALRVGAPHRQRADAVSLAQPLSSPGPSSSTMPTSS